MATKGPFKSSPEENSLGGRVKRYDRVGSAVGGVAARLAGAKYLGKSIDKDAHARDLRVVGLHEGGEPDGGAHRRELVDQLLQPGLV